jgi:hypothetical protein
MPKLPGQCRQVGDQGPVDRLGVLTGRVHVERSYVPRPSGRTTSSAVLGGLPDQVQRPRHPARRPVQPRSSPAPGSGRRRWPHRDCRESAGLRRRVRRASVDHGAGISSSTSRRASCALAAVQHRRHRAGDRQAFGEAGWRSADPMPRVVRCGHRRARDRCRGDHRRRAAAGP